jgi:transcription antitermination factor NusA-like protein/ribosome biogenesis GTPase A
MGHVHLGETLKRSQQMARETFEAAESVFNDVQQSLARFDDALGKAADRHAQMNDDKDAELKKVLAPLVLDKRNRIRERFANLREAHARRRNKLDDFTLMFFGRTMVGKSTTIEALTAGDGSTIGAGDPDFTTDISGKFWDGLTLIDTPGLLGFREDLHGIAEAYVDRADVICMVVMDDSIEPLLFQRMREVRGQNKHLVVLLNVKAANNPILRHEAEDAFDEREIGELIEFIQERLREVFPGEPATVIPYCANAAFEAQRADDPEESEYLWRESRIDDVIGYLIRTIETRGVPIRATAGFDSLGHYVQSIAEEIEADLPALKGQIQELWRKRAEAEKMFGRVMRDSVSDLARLKDHFRRVHETLHELAWEYARGDRKEPVKAAFRRACKWNDVQTFQRQFQTEVLERLRRNVEHFRDMLGQDLTSAVALSGDPDGGEADYGDIDLEAGSWKRKGGKVVRIVGAAAAGLGGATVGAKAGAVIGTLIGGPPGTVLGGVVGFLGCLLGGLFAGWGTKKIGDVIVDSGLEDQVHAQHDLQERLRDRLWAKYRELNNELYVWLKLLVESTKGTVTQMLDEYVRAVGALIREGDALVGDLHKARHTLARRSFDALLHAVHPAFRDGRAVLVDASQWMQYRAKILVRGRDRRPIAGLVIGKGGELVRLVREHTGNAIDVVEVDSEGLTPKMVAEALLPARIPPAAVDIGTAVHVMLPQHGVGAALGRRRRNLMLAQEILGVHIRIRVSSDSGGRQ